MKRLFTILLLLLVTRPVLAQTHPCDVAQTTSFTIPAPAPPSIDIQACMFVADAPTGLVANIDGTDFTGGPSFTQLTPTPNAQGKAQYSISITTPAAGTHTLNVYAVNAAGRATSAAGPFPLVIAGTTTSLPRPASNVVVKGS